MTYVERQRTPMLDRDAWDLVDRTLGEHTDDYVSPNQVRMSRSLLGGEHGAGEDIMAPALGRACWNLWNWNWGNRRGGAGDSGSYYMVAPEIIDGRRKEIGGGWPAFSTAELGLLAWYRKMAEDYGAAWSYLLALQVNRGSVTPFAEALKSGWYMTGDVREYAAGLAEWYRIFAARGW